MRILFVIDTLGSGGKERRFTELLKGLSGMQEVESELVVMSEDVHYKEIYDLGVQVHVVLRQTVNDPRVFIRLFNIMKVSKPEIVHCWESMTAVYVAPLCRILKCVMVNGMVTNVPAQRNIFNKHWRRARITFPFSSAVVSNSAAGLVAYRTPEKKGVVIYPGFNYDRLRNLSDSELIRGELDIQTKYIVGMVANHSRNKDYKTFYNAAQAILDERSDITFLSIGNGTDAEEAYGMVDSGKRSSFRFLGRKSGVESLINAMDIGVLSTYTEGISNAVLEYMALGKPVIATDGGGTSEIVVDGITGFLVSQSDSFMLGDKIRILLDDEELRSEMGNAGRKRVREMFTIDRMINGYINLYKRVLGR